MKTKSSLGLFVALALLTVSVFAQQEITVTATAANTVASKTTIDVPGLGNNPNAIIIAKPTGSTNILHPIGAWYYNNKWHIFNTDHANMQLGSTFKVQIFSAPNANQFLHVITQSGAGQDFTILDYPALNNNPDAKFEIFQNHSPDNRPFYLFPYRVEANYSVSLGKWLIQYVGPGSQIFHANTAYNIVITSAGSHKTVTEPLGTSPPSNLPPQIAPTNPVALTVVAKTEWSLPGFVSSDLSDSILFSEECRSFKYAEPGILKTDTVIVTPQDQVVQMPNTLGATEEGTFQYLEWAGGAASQFARIKLCNRFKTKAMVKGLKVNILVLR